jgi:hypothetical protein
MVRHGRASFFVADSTLFEGRFDPDPAVGAVAFLEEQLATAVPLSHSASPTAADP